MNPSPVTFESRGGEVFDIRLGVHSIGTLMPRGDGRAYIWACALPPMCDVQWHSKPSLPAAQKDCIDHVEQWLQGVGSWCEDALKHWRAVEKGRG